ncbi:MAG: transposase [Pseudonocardiaceae bacterium]
MADLTGILRAGPGGDRLATWPSDLRVIARRGPRPPGKQAKLGEDPNWEYGAVATNTATGQTQWLDARHRTQAHVEDRVKQLKACGARNLPSIDYGRNAAWLQLAALAVSLTAWLRHLALPDKLATASTKTLRFRILSAPARMVTHARRRLLKIPPGWTWAHDLATAWHRIQALHPA